MANKRITAYCVLLAMLIFAGTICLSTGEAQARYSNRIICSTVLETAKTELSSNILVKSTEAPVTALLGEISGEKTVGFWVKASGAKANEKMSWSVDSEYVSVEITAGETAVKSGDEITLSGDTETEILMRIVPSEESHGAFTAKIDVAVGELRGVFEADIPEKEAPEPEDSGSSDIPAEEQTGTSSGEAPTVNTGSSETEPEIEIEEAVEGNASVVESPGAGLRTLTRCDPKGKLPIKMALPNGITSVKIGFYENNALVPLPDGTKISIDEGKNFYTVYGGGIVGFDIGRISITDSGYSILLDFENAETGEAEKITVAAETYSGENKTGTYTVSSVPNVIGTGKTEIDFAVEEMETGESGVSGAEEAGYYILSAGDSLLTKFPKEWAGEAALSCSVRILSLAGNESPIYSDVELSEKSLWTSYTVGEENCDLMLDIGEVLPDAGTYQAYIRWEFDGICFYKKQITFFINYSTDIYSTLES